MTLVFSCECCKISKNTFSYRTPLVAASLHSCSFYSKNYLKMLSWILLVFKAVKGYLYMKAIWNSSLWCSPTNRSENILKNEYEKVIHKIKWYVKYLLFNFSLNRDSMRCVLFWISMRCILVWILQSFSQEFLCRTL